MRFRHADHEALPTPIRFARNALPRAGWKAANSGEPSNTCSVSS